MFTAGGKSSSQQSRVSPEPSPLTQHPKSTLETSHPNLHLILLTYALHTQGTDLSTLPPTSQSNKPPKTLQKLKSKSKSKSKSNTPKPHHGPPLQPRRLSPSSRTRLYHDPRNVPLDHTSRVESIRTQKRIRRENKDVSCKSRSRMYTYPPCLATIYHHTFTCSAHLPICSSTLKPLLISLHNRILPIKSTPPVSFPFSFSWIDLSSKPETKTRANTCPFC